MGWLDPAVAAPDAVPDVPSIALCVAPKAPPAMLPLPTGPIDFVSLLRDDLAPLPPSPFPPV